MLPYELPETGDPCPVCLWPEAAAAGGWMVDADVHAVALVPERQRVPGALVVVPRVHAATPSQLNEAEVVGLWQLARRATTAIEALHHPDGLHTWHDIGQLADAPFAHLVIELVPRHASVPYTFQSYAKVTPTDDDARRAQAAALRAALGPPTP